MLQTEAGQAGNRDKGRTRPPKRVFATKAQKTQEHPSPAQKHARKRFRGQKQPKKAQPQGHGRTIRADAAGNRTAKSGQARTVGSDRRPETVAQADTQRSTQNDPKQRRSPFEATKGRQKARKGKRRKRTQVQSKNAAESDLEAKNSQKRRVVQPQKRRKRKPGNRRKLRRPKPGRSGNRRRPPETGPPGVGGGSWPTEATRGRGRQSNRGRTEVPRRASWHSSRPSAKAQRSTGVEVEAGRSMAARSGFGLDAEASLDDEIDDWPARCGAR